MKCDWRREQLGYLYRKSYQFPECLKKQCVSDRSGNKLNVMGKLQPLRRSRIIVLCCIIVHILAGCV